LIGSYCPGQYFYGRVLGKPERPAWASVGGSAVHSATEDWDRRTVETGEFETDPEILRGYFETALDIEIRKTEDTSPFPRDEWRASGRVSKDWPDKENEKWWRANGPTMVARWVTWRLTSGWEIAWLAVPTMIAPIDGQDEPYEDYRTIPGIEIPFKIELGGVPIQGYVDRVFERNGEYLCVDLKSGSMEPKTAGQLGTYRAGVLEEYGVDCTRGAFWMARSGASGPLHDLTLWTPQRLDFTYREARAVQERGAFMHRASNLCGSCAFQKYCPEVNGELAAETMQPWQITEVRIADARRP
jgi:hypothetical protein